LKNSIYLALSLFLFTILSGYILSKNLSLGLLEALGSIFGEIMWDPFSMMILILFNNSVKCFIIVLLGVLLGIVPIIFVTVNGFIIGATIFEVKTLLGLPFALMVLLPHGIIETPSFLISCAIGFHLGNELLSRIKGKGEIGIEFKTGMKFFLLRILPLLFLAAFVESYVTPFIINLLF
jgi:stage II sporulation protein M